MNIINPLNRMKTLNRTKGKDNKHSSLFKQYLLLFFIIAFIPSFIACTSLYFSYKTLEDEVNRSNLASVELIQQSLDGKIQNLDSTLQVIGNDPELTRYALKNNPYTTADNLSKLVSLQDILADILIVSNNYDDDTIYSASGRYSISSLSYHNFMKNLEKTGHSSVEYLELLQNVSTPVYWPTNVLGNSSNYLCLIAPVYSSFYNEQSGQHSTRTVTFLIRQDYIQNLFRSSQTTSEENILLLDRDMELLSYLTPQATEKSILQICQYLKDNPDFSESISLDLDGKEHLIFISHSEVTGLYYVRFLSEEIAYQSIYTLRYYTVAILILVLLISIILIIYGMRHSYLPIHSLVNWIQDEHNIHSEVNNELAFFKQIFEDTFEKNATLSETLDNSKYGLTDHLLTALFQGNFVAEEAFHNACRNLGIQLDKKYYCVCSLNVEENVNENKAPDFVSILETVQNALPEGLLLQMKNLLFSDKLVFVLNGDFKEPEFYQAALEDIKKRLFEQEGLLTSMGLGSLYDSYDKVGKSYLESVNALDYRLIYGRNCLITPNMYIHTSSDIGYPTGDLEILYTAIVSHNTELATKIIQRLQEFTKSKNCSLHAAKYICFDTFSVLRKTPAFSNLGYVDTLSQNLNITQLTNFETVDEFFVALVNIVENTIIADTSYENDATPDTGQQLINYIGSHCFHYDFQISSMAEHFNISPQYMRKLFKNYTGIGLSEYISKMKLEKAMQLLRDTDMSLNDIVAEIGNTDVSGFIRFFKKGTGITPGQYRKMNQEQNKK